MKKIWVLFIMAIYFVYQLDADSSCLNMPTGLKRMRSGLDISRLDLFPRIHTTTGGYRFPVTGRNCSLGKTWLSPYDGIRYQIADEVFGYQAVPSGTKDVHSEMHCSRNSLKRHMGAEVELRLAYGFSLVKDSSDYKLCFLITPRSGRDP